MLSSNQEELNSKIYTELSEEELEAISGAGLRTLAKQVGNALYDFAVDVLD